MAKVYQISSFVFYLLLTQVTSLSVVRERRESQTGNYYGTSSGNQYDNSALYNAPLAPLNQPGSYYSDAPLAPLPSNDPGIKGGYGGNTANLVGNQYPHSQPGIKGGDRLVSGQNNGGWGSYGTQWNQTHSLGENNPLYPSLSTVQQWNQTYPGGNPNNQTYGSNYYGQNQPNSPNQWNQPNAPNQGPYGQGSQWNQPNAQNQGPYGQGSQWNQTHPVPYGQGSQGPYGQGSQWNQTHPAPYGQGSQGPYGQGSQWNQTHPVPYGQGSQGPYGQGSQWNQTNPAPYGQGSQGPYGQGSQWNQTHPAPYGQGSQGPYGQGSQWNQTHPVPYGQGSQWNQPTPGNQGQYGNYGASTPHYGSTGNYGTQWNQTRPVPYGQQGNQYNQTHHGSQPHPSSQYGNQPTQPTSPQTIKIRSDIRKTYQEVVQCVSACPTTKNYAPICGTDLKTYPNIQALSCAYQCGADVRFSYNGAC